MNYHPTLHQKELAKLAFQQDGWSLRLLDYPSIFRIEVWRDHGKLRYNHDMQKGTFSLDDAEAVFNSECDKVRFECYSDF